jgi:hypothetical protein
MNEIPLYYSYLKSSGSCVSTSVLTAALFYSLALLSTGRRLRAGLPSLTVPRCFIRAGSRAILP